MRIAANAASGAFFTSGAANRTIASRVSAWIIPARGDHAQERTLVSGRAMASVAGRPPKSGETMFATSSAMSSTLGLCLSLLIRSEKTADIRDSIAKHGDRQLERQQLSQEVVLQWGTARESASHSVFSPLTVVADLTFAVVLAVRDTFRMNMRAERWCSRDESIHDHRGCECTVASPAEPAARGLMKMAQLGGKVPVDIRRAVCGSGHEDEMTRCRESGHRTGDFCVRWAGNWGRPSYPLASACLYRVIAGAQAKGYSLQIFTHR